MGPMAGLQTPRRSLRRAGRPARGHGVAPRWSGWSWRVAVGVGGPARRSPASPCWTVCRRDRQWPSSGGATIPDRSGRPGSRSQRLPRSRQPRVRLEDGDQPVEYFGFAGVSPAQQSEPGPEHLGVERGGDLSLGLATLHLPPDRSQPRFATPSRWTDGQKFSHGSILRPAGPTGGGLFSGEDT